MKRVLPLVLVFLLMSALANAQLWKLKRYEIQLGAGPSQFFGDIGGFSRTENVLGFRDLTFKQTGINANIGIKYRIAGDADLKLNFTYGLLRANDERGANVERGFAATTSLFEQTLTAEYFFIKNSSENSYAYMKGRGINSSIFSTVDIYGFTGFGGLLYNVRPNDKFEPFLAEPSGYAAIIPIGIGCSMVYSPALSLGFEFAGRYVFSDKIEGYISQYSRDNDVYYFLNITFTYKLKTNP